MVTLKGSPALIGGSVAALASGRSRRLTDIVETTVVVRKFRRLQPCGVCGCFMRNLHWLGRLAPHHGEPQTARRSSVEHGARADGFAAWGFKSGCGRYLV